MPKPLREPPPSSSVAKLFDVGAAARAVAQPPPQPLQDTAQSVAVPSSPWGQLPQPPLRNVDGARVAEKLVKRDFGLTPSSNDTLEHLVQVLRDSTGARLGASAVVRALLKGAAHCFDQIEREAKRLGPLKLPSTAPGHELERDRFEARLADALISGIQRSGAFDQRDK